MCYNFVNFVNLSKCDCYKWYTWPMFCVVLVLDEKFSKLQNSRIYNKIIKQSLGLICILEETPADDACHAASHPPSLSKPLLVPIRIKKLALEVCYGVPKLCLRFTLYKIVISSSALY